MPVRWLCPVAAGTRVYNTKCDVYSFGVVMWEIYNKGITPYGELLAAEVLGRVRNGYKLRWSVDSLASDAVRQL